MHNQSIADNTPTRQTYLCKVSPSRLYHVTPVENIASVLRFGVDPAFSQSHPERVYLVQRDALHWAIQHISKKHDTPIERLAVFRCYGGKRCKRLSAYGLWYADHAKAVISCESAVIYA